MKLFFLVLTLAIVKAGLIKEETCEGIVFDGNYHDIETLKSELDRPYLLAVDNNNIVYFSYNINDTVFTSARYDLGTKEFKKIEDIPNGFAQAVDEKTDTVYIGGNNGIYIYDTKSHTSKLFTAKDEDIWRIYVKDVLYYSEYPTQFLNIVIDGNVERFKDLEDTKVDQFVIDGEDEMFYTNDTGLYAQKKGTKDAVLYSEDVNIRALTVDRNGDAYVCTVDKILKIRKDNTSVEKLLEIDDCFGLAFDNENNMIYSDDTGLYRLKVNKDKTCN